MHFYKSVLHYLYTKVDGTVIHANARAFKAGQGHKLKAKAKKFGLKAKD